MDLCMTTLKVYILFTFSVCSVTNIRYKKVGTTCLKQNNIYYTTYARSKIECSYYCTNNPYIPCTRFIFKPEEKQCILHSDDYVSTSPTGEPTTTSVISTEDWDYYGDHHSGQ